MERPDPAVQGGKATIGKRKFPLGTVIALLALALLAGLVWYLTRGASAPAAGGPGASRGTQTAAPVAAAGARPGMATTVGFARAERADIPVQLDALGTVTSPAAAAVRAQVSGVLRKIHYTEGQAVKVGQLLAEIDPRPFEMALLQASGQRQRDEAQLANAQLLLKRYQTLLEQDSIARQEVDTQAALVKQLEGTVMTDRAAEGIARLNLSYTKVTAPIAGRIGLRNVDVGNVTGPNDANGVAVITQMAPIDVVFSVPQDQLPALRKRQNAGEPMQVTAWDRTRSTLLATGTFLALDNLIDGQTGTARAKARFTNQSLTLFPGQFVNVRLQLGTVPDSVLIPVAALRHGNTGDYVYLLNAEKKSVKVQAVKSGQIFDDKVQILSGLRAGMPVITEGADRLQDGATVNLAGDRPAGRGMRGQGGQPGPGGQAGPRGQGGQGGASAQGPQAQQRQPGAGSASVQAGPDGPASAGKANAAGAQPPLRTPAQPQ